jgi:hypothetical protein
LKRGRKLKKTNREDKGKGKPLKNERRGKETEETGGAVTSLSAA